MHVHVDALGEALEMYAQCRISEPLPDKKILDWSKLKEIADDILKCIENMCHIG